LTKILPSETSTYINGQVDSLTQISFSVGERDMIGTFPIVAFGGAQGSSLTVNQYFRGINPKIDVTFTQYAFQLNEFFIGNFSGTFEDTNGDTHTLSGDFRIRRLD